MAVAPFCDLSAAGRPLPKAMASSSIILRVAVPSPVRRSFDYLPPPDVEPRCLLPGIRLRVPFGRRNVIGVLLELVSRPRIDRSRLKAAVEALDTCPVVPDPLLRLAAWASDYYHHPPGDVFSHLLPGLLRQGRAPRRQVRTLWRLTDAGRAVDPGATGSAMRQSAILKLLQTRTDAVAQAELNATFPHCHAPLKRLQEKGWIRPTQAPVEPPSRVEETRALSVNPGQTTAVDAVSAALGRFEAFLLEGVTGSGKTEVYLRIIERVLARGDQALVLLPEIGLTPQMIGRFRSRLEVAVALYHSGLSERERLDAWVMAGSGEAPVILGTRSAVFLPLARPGILIVDEEHDMSYKQQEGFRYHARDVAVMRARQASIPVVLGSATPSLESLYNAARGRYRHLTLANRAGNALPPRMRLLDIRQRPLEDGVSDTLLQAAARHLDHGNQVLIFLNRRGYAPTVLCHDCGWVARCQRCDAHLVLHQGDGVLRCHHCGGQQALPGHCPECRSAELRPLGQGTERIEQSLRRRFAGHEVIRIDRDSTRRKGTLQALLDKVREGKGMILVGTQMMAKGHHLPDVTLVGVLNADAGLFSADFRASERMAQTIIQVAGRAGRSDKPGTVLIQTHHPEHAQLQALIDNGYPAFARALMDERRQAELPPFAGMALMRAEATEQSAPQAFLTEARRKAEHRHDSHVQLLGPVPAPMERRAGRYRAQLLIQARRRSHLHELLDAWLPEVEGLPAARKVRWSLDVDPMELL